MARRDESVADTKSALESAFQRLKDGKPIRVEGAYRISPSKVEQEAGKSTGTIYQRPYKDIHQAVKQYKSQKTAEERGLSSSIELLEDKLLAKNEELKDAREKIERLRAEQERKEQEFRTSLGDCEDIISWLASNISKECRLELAQRYGKKRSGGDGSNVINIKDRE